MYSVLFVTLQITTVDSRYENTTKKTQFNFGKKICISFYIAVITVITGIAHKRGERVNFALN